MTQEQKNAIRNLINGIYRANKAGAFDLQESGVLARSVEVVVQLITEQNGTDSQEITEPETSSKN